VAAVVAGAAVLPAQQTVLRDPLHSVRVDVVVTDGGRPVTGLTAADFDVFDNGVPQTIEAVATAGHVAVAMVLDTSASLHGQLLQARRVVPAGQLQRDLHAAARTFAGALGPGDRASLVTFADRISLAVRSTGDRHLVLAALEAVEAQRPAGVPRTVAWDAVFAGAALVAPAPTGRPLVVFFSDGLDNASWLTKKQTADALRATGIAVDFVHVPRTYANPDDPGPGPHYPEQIAGATGGERFAATDSRLAEKFARRLEALRAGYVLTYTPSGVKQDEGWHGLRVRLKEWRGRVEAREGYYAGPVGVLTAR
jgi:VWFA-related protein